MGRLHQGALLALLLACPLCWQAPLAAEPEEEEEERWYQVDLLVFRYKAGDLADEGEPKTAPVLPAGMVAIAPADGPRPLSLPQLRQLEAIRQQEAEEEAARLAEAEALAAAEAAALAESQALNPNQPQLLSSEPGTLISEPRALFSEPQAPNQPRTLDQPRALDQPRTLDQPRALGAHHFLYAHQADTALNRWLVDSHQRRQQGLELPYYMRASSRWAPARLDPVELDALGMNPSTAFNEVREGSLLTRAEQRIRNYGDLELLMHQSWIQPVGEEPVPVLVQTGARHGDFFEVEGVLALSRHRQLRLATDFWVTAYKTKRGRRLFNWAALFGGEVELSSETLAQYPDLVAADDKRGRVAPASRYLLQHARSVQAGQINYIDHPLIGMLVSLSRHQLPEDLAEEPEEGAQGSQETSPET